MYSMLTSPKEKTSFNMEQNIFIQHHPASKNETETHGIDCGDFSVERNRCTLASHQSDLLLMYCENKCTLMFG